MDLLVLSIRAVVMVMSLLGDEPTDAAHPARRDTVDVATLLLCMLLV